MELDSYEVRVFLFCGLPKTYSYSPERVLQQKDSPVGSCYELQRSMLLEESLVEYIHNVTYRYRLDAWKKRNRVARWQGHCWAMCSQNLRSCATSFFYREGCVGNKVLSIAASSLKTFEKTKFWLTSYIMLGWVHKELWPTGYLCTRIYCTANRKLRELGRFDMVSGIRCDANNTSKTTPRIVSLISVGIAIPSPTKYECAATHSRGHRWAPLSGCVSGASDWCLAQRVIFSWKR